MCKFCVSLMASNSLFLGRNMGDLQMAVGCFGCVLRRGSCSQTEHLGGR